MFDLGESVDFKKAAFRSQQILVVPLYLNIGLNGVELCKSRMSISLGPVNTKKQKEEKVSVKDDDEVDMNSDRYVFSLSTLEDVDIEDLRRSELNIIDEKRKTDASKDIIITRLRDKFMMVVATREKIAEKKADVEEDLEWSAEQREKCADGEYFYKSHIAKQKDLQIFDNEKRIEEYVLAKTLEAVHVRLSKSKMKADMIILQENAILEAFQESNYLISKAACKWQMGHYVRALATRVRATLKEQKAYQRYAEIVAHQARASDTDTGLKDSSYLAWSNRVATDVLVVLELKNILNATKAAGESVSIVKARWNYARAEAILAADQEALNLKQR